MEEVRAWQIEQIQEWASSLKDYKERALLKEVAALLKEEDKRIQYHKMELDGRLWSPSEW